MLLSASIWYWRINRYFNVGNSELNVEYQLQLTDGTNGLGLPVEGNGGTISLTYRDTYIYNWNFK